MILDLEDKPEKTVILATNFTDSARNASRFAINLFKDQKVKYVLLNSYYEPPLRHDALYSTEELQDRNNGRLDDEKELLLKEFPGLKLEFETHSAFALLIAAINDTVASYKADYVVIGNKTAFDLDTTLMGYKTANFIRKIDCPVLAIPDGFLFEKMDIITLASDMKSIKDMDVLKPALEVLIHQHAKLNILYVSDKEELLVGQQAEVGLYLDNYFAEVKHEFHHTDNQFVTSGISRFLEKQNSGMVILLARKHNFFERLMKSSNTQMMSELARTPMMVLHE